MAGINVGGFVKWTKVWSGKFYLTLISASLLIFCYILGYTYFRYIFLPYSAVYTIPEAFQF